MTTEDKLRPYNPSFRTIDIGAEAKRMLGSTWNAPEQSYEFAGGKRKFFLRTEDAGIYSPILPDAVTGVSAVVGVEQATVSFTPSTLTGTSTVTSYTVTSSPGGITATGTSSPIVITGLSSTPYTFTVTATNAAGTSPASAASNSVTPPVYATFDASSKNADVTLSGSNLIASTTIDGYRQANTNTFVNTLVRYAEFTISGAEASTSVVVGLNLSTASMANGNFPGYGVGELGYGVMGDGRTWRNGANLAHSPLAGTVSAGQVVSLLFDTAALTLKVYVDGVELLDAIGGTAISGIAAGSYCLAVAVRKQASGCSITLNAGASAWAYPAIPSGAGAVGVYA